VSWPFYLGSVAFFTLLVGVFLAVACSVLLGVYDNYLRYYQKAELQWTGRNSRFKRKRVPFFKLILLAFLISWLVVHFLIAP
jgi:hypothetical protein